MASDMFLKLDGVKGESTVKGHEKDVEILNFSLGASNPVNLQGGGGGMGASKVNMSSIHLSKTVDAASPVLFNACCAGKHFPNGTITVRKAGGTPLEYLVYELTEVFVENIQWSGGGGGEVPHESLSLVFGKIHVLYKTQNVDGTAKDTIGAMWNVKTNTGSDK